MESLKESMRKRKRNDTHQRDKHPCLGNPTFQYIQGRLTVEEWLRASNVPETIHF